MKIGVVIPCYKVAGQIRDVVLSIPLSVSHIIVVDDKCPHFSGKEVEKNNDDRIVIIYHDRNTGVGGATISGYKKAIEKGCDIIIKMDGDGQMDAGYIDKLIAPLLSNEADYTKGNRFINSAILKVMPKIRLIGNSALSFLVKIASGYWNIMDPNNGYTAIRKEVLKEIELDKISKRYFFETDMLINLNIINAVAKDVNIPPKYGEEASSLNLIKVTTEFPFKLIRGFAKRIFMKYFIYDFNMASVYILFGVPMFIFGVTLGFVEWRNSMVQGTGRPLGTIMLIALSVTISFQMLLQAISIDINLTPTRGK